jgi:Holliday junction resolvase-like predicted endonuclease
LESITARKRAQVIRAARLFLESETITASGFRFDVVGVTFPVDGGPPQVVHLPNAFDLAGI